MATCRKKPRGAAEAEFSPLAVLFWQSAIPSLLPHMIQRGRKGAILKKGGYKAAGRPLFLVIFGGGAKARAGRLSASAGQSLEGCAPAARTGIVRDGGLRMKIAVSACLLGKPCRYDGASKPCAQVMALADAEGLELVPVCPECAGGLPVPRAPSEIVSPPPELRVLDSRGADNTEAFLLGARRTLDLVRREGCKAAILKAKSPSCGTGLVYDGSFTGRLVPGFGVAAQMLIEAGIPLANETDFPEVLGEILGGGGRGSYSDTCSA